MQAETSSLFPILSRLFSVSVVTCLFSFTPFLFADNNYTVSVNLRWVKEDRVFVSIRVPDCNQLLARYVMPSSVPGTYSKYDFGRYIVDSTIQCLDKKGKQLKWKRDGLNDILIEDAKRLYKIEYWVDDTFDDTRDPYPFQPSGSDFEENEIFVLNHHCLIGYIDGLKMSPYIINVHRPMSMIGATSLPLTTIADTTDQLTAKSYVHLIDNPVMFGKLDTTSYMQGKTRVTIAVYSTKGKVKASTALPTIMKVTSAAERFLGTMPVAHYTFLMYFAAPDRRDITRGQAWGALEHNYCSFYFLPESNDPEGMISSTAVHEFFHILIPLNLHSHEIADFNFKTPKMSKHLWLYEGATEYFANLAQLQSGNYTETGFMNEMKRKLYIGEAIAPKVFSWSDFSTNVLTEKGQKLFPIVYEKGAILCFMLDAKLRELSKGELTLLKLVRKLSDKYGADRPFNDDELFDEIVESSYPEIRTFIEDFIVGEKLDEPDSNLYAHSIKKYPYREFFENLGWIVDDNRKQTSYSFGKLSLRSIEDGEHLFVARIADSSSTISFQEGDIITKINGQNLTSETRWVLVNEILYNPTSGDEVTISLQRGGKDVDISASPRLSQKTVARVFEKNPEATPEHKKFFQQFLMKQ